MRLWLLTSRPSSGTLVFPGEETANHMAHKKSAKQKAIRVQQKIAKKRGAMGYCVPCGKFLWPTCEKANQRIEELKTKPGVKKPHLLSSYHCRQGGDGFHIGHDFKLGLPISLCTGEHK